MDSYQGRLPNFPAGLLLLSVGAFGLSAFAAGLGFEGQPLVTLLLGLTWLAIAASLLSFLSAHRVRCLDPMKEGAAPGTRALEGVLLREEGRNVFVAGSLRYEIPSYALGDEVQDGQTMTLLGEFAASSSALFRERATQNWPKSAKLHPRGLDALLRRRVRFATGVSYAAIAVAIILSGELLTNMY